MTKVGIALTCQIMTSDEYWLAEQAGSLPARAVRRLDAGLELALDLG